MNLSYDTLQPMNKKRSKTDPRNKAIRGLRFLTEIIAFALCTILIVASMIITYQASIHIIQGNASTAVLDALYVVILLELFYVIRSFIKRGSMNVGVIINVGIIASVKEMIFKLDSLEMQMAISFGVIFSTLGLLYVLEMIHYERKKNVPDDEED